MTTFTTHPSAAALQEQALQNKRLILTAIDKGGVGKSFFCVRLIEWLREAHRSFIAFDPDFNNSTLTLDFSAGGELAVNTLRISWTCRPWRPACGPAPDLIRWPIT